MNKLAPTMFLRLSDSGAPPTKFIKWYPIGPSEKVAIAIYPFLPHDFLLELTNLNVICKFSVFLVQWRIERMDGYGG